MLWATGDTRYAVGCIRGEGGSMREEINRDAGPASA